MDEDLESAIKEVHFDNMLMRNKSGGNTVPAIVGRCRYSTRLEAHVVPMNGYGEDWIATQRISITGDTIYLS